jgi:predicted DCC family thiol-disulfide oxidoreductase YuxK
MRIDSAPVLYFDGVCNLCNSAVQFVIRHDKRKLFRFASLQSAAGQLASATLPHPLKTADSILLYEQGAWYGHSTAALRTLRLLGGGWQLLYIFIIVPPFIRDAVYRLIARNRYKWFGKREQCMVATADLKVRFLD